MISSKSGAMLSYSFPSSVRMGPRWNSTSSMAIFGRSAMRVRRRAFAIMGSVSSRRKWRTGSFSSITLTFISDAPPAPAALGLRAVVRYGGDVLDAPDADPGAGERADRGLGPGSVRLGAVAPGGAHADVQGVDPLLLRRVGDALRGPHRRVGRGLVLRRLDDHAARALRDRLGTGEVGDRDHDVVVGREDVRDAPLHGCSPSPPPASGAAGPSGASEAGTPVRAGWRSFATGERGSYTMASSSSR